MATNALIYEAYILFANKVMDVAGFMYGLIDGEEFDGERQQTYHIREAWIEDMGISVKDMQGHEYMILSLDDNPGALVGNLHHLFALSFLYEKPSNA